MEPRSVSPDGQEQSRRRRRHHALPASQRRLVYDWVAISFLLAPPVVGIFLFGAVRLWSICPLMILSFLGSAMFLARPFFAGDLRRLQIPIGGIPWLVFLLYAALMIPRAAVPYDAKIEVLKIASYIGAFWAWSELASRQGRWRIVLGLMLFVVTMIGWYAVIQHCHGSRLVLHLERPEVYGMRASGTYFCPNHFANLLEICIPAALAILLMAPAGLPLRLLAGYSLALFLPVVVMTQSRSGWLGTAAGVFVTLWLIAWRKGRRAVAIVTVAAPLTILAAAAVLWFASPVVRERVQGMSLANPDQAVQARLMMWSDAIPMIKANPVLGYGPGSFSWVYPAFRSRDLRFQFNYVHNEYLHSMIDYGVVGFALMALVVGWVVLRLLRFVRAASRDKEAFLIAGFVGSLAAGLVHAFFDFNFHLFSNIHVLVMMGGVVMAALYASGDLKAWTPPWSWGRILWGGGVAAALLLAVLTGQVLLSYGFHLRGESVREKLQLSKAERLLGTARRLDRGNWRPHLSLGHIQQTRSFWNQDAESKKAQATEALAHYKRALALNPFDMETAFGLSKVCNSLGDPETALFYSQMTITKEPRHLFYVSHYGLQLRRMGRYEEALKFFEGARTRWQTDMIDINIRFLREKIREQQDALPPADKGNVGPSAESVPGV